MGSLMTSLSMAGSIQISEFPEPCRAHNAAKKITLCIFHQKCNLYTHFDYCRYFDQPSLNYKCYKYKHRLLQCLNILCVSEAWFFKREIVHIIVNLEVPWPGASNKYPEHMFVYWRNKKIFISQPLSSEPQPLESSISSFNRHF